MFVEHLSRNESEIIVSEAQKRDAGVGILGQLNEPAINETSDLRPKNQITIPKSVARAMQLQPGDRLVFVVEDGDADHAHLYRMPRSFAGVAPCAYGGPNGAADYLAEERKDWEV